MKQVANCRGAQRNSYPLHRLSLPMKRNHVQQSLGQDVGIHARVKFAPFHHSLRPRSSQDTASIFAGPFLPTEYDADQASGLIPVFGAVLRARHLAKLVATAQRTLFVRLGQPVRLFFLIQLRLVELRRPTRSPFLFRPILAQWRRLLPRPLLALAPVQILAQSGYLLQRFFELLAEPLHQYHHR